MSGELLVETSNGLVDQLPWWQLQRWHEYFEHKQKIAQDRSTRRSVRGGRSNAARPQAVSTNSPEQRFAAFERSLGLTPEIETRQVVSMASDN